MLYLPLWYPPCRVPGLSGEPHHLGEHSAYRPIHEGDNAQAGRIACFAGIRCWSTGQIPRDDFFSSRQFGRITLCRVRPSSMDVPTQSGAGLKIMMSGWCTSSAVLMNPFTPESRPTLKGVTTSIFGGPGRAISGDGSRKRWCIWKPDIAGVRQPNGNMS